MANDIIVSEMTSASQINTNDLMIMTQPDLQAETGYSTKKGTVLQVANKMLKGTEYLTDLPDFTNKTVLGGLEELKGDLTALLPVNTASGAIANFDTDLSLPLVDCKASIVASQASGTPTPSNPLPISGYTEAKITRCGVNLFDKANVISAYCDYSSRLIYNNDFKSVVVPLKNGVQYLFSQSLLGVFDRFAVCDSLEDNTTIYNPITPNITGLYAGGVPFTFTNSENKKYLICSIWRNTDTYTFDEIASTCQLELASTASTYTAYNGTTYAVSWQDEAGTVYGGNIDLTTGVLTVTHGEIDSYNGESINEPWLSSKDVYTEGGTPTTGAQVVYPLTMPITYQLTPVQVQALLGVNNVFNDTNGDTEVKYKEGIQHYIDKKIAATQALIL